MFKGWLVSQRRTYSSAEQISQSINTESAYTETWPALYK